MIVNGTTESKYEESRMIANGRLEVPGRKPSQTTLRQYAILVYIQIHNIIIVTRGKLGKRSLINNFTNLQIILLD